MTLHIVICDSEKYMELFQLHTRMFSGLISQSFPAGVYLLSVGVHFMLQNFDSMTSGGL